MGWRRPRARPERGSPIAPTLAALLAPALAPVLALVLAACAPPPPALPPVDADAVLTRAWEARMDAVAAHAAALRASSRQVYAELPFETRRPEPWARIVLADFAVARDAESFPVREEMPPGPRIDAVGTFTHAGVTVRLAGLSWDRVLIDLGGAEVPDEALGALLAEWQYDPARQAVPRAPGHVHRIEPRAGGLLVDFGTAPPRAFLDLVEALGRSGIREIAVGA